MPRSRAGWSARAAPYRGKAGFEVELVLAELWEAAALPTQPWGHLLPASEPGRQSIAKRVPLGVVGVISPWNFPLILSTRAVAPALALGNAVILKPDAQTAVSGGILLARLFEVAGLPGGVLHVLPGDAEPGAALAESPDVAMVSFTGSTAVGRLVGEAAGRTLKRVSLELGGNNALIVLDDADIDVASSAGAWGAFLHQGQVCMTAGRHIVLESVAQEYLDRLAKRAENLPVGNPHTEQVALGPLINERQLANVDRIVTETVAAGASVRAGGTHEQLYYRHRARQRPDAEQRRVRAVRRHGCLRQRQPVRLAEQLGRVHPVAVGHRAAAGPRLPVLTRCHSLPRFG